MPLMLALKFPDKLVFKGPGFCSHIEFEFYIENNSNNEYVQVVFDGIPVKLKGQQSSMIKREDFLSFTKWVRRTEEEHFEDLTQSHQMYKRFTPTESVYSAK